MIGSLARAHVTPQRSAHLRHYSVGAPLPTPEAVQEALQLGGVAKRMTSCESSSSSSSSGSSRSVKGKNLLGLSEAELQALLAPELAGERAASAARAVQRALYGAGGAREVAHMRGVPRAVRELLQARGWHVALPQPAADQRAADGTRKWLMALPDDGARVETVFIPEARRGTLCVSSQVGCSLSCRFCHTGTQPVLRNLHAGEIVGQLLAARAQLGDAGGQRVVTHVVFMGQGEPMYNWRAVSRAIELMRLPGGLAMGRARITVSTSGVVPHILAMAAQPRAVQLALSLHAVRDDLRSQLVPLNRQFPLAPLIAATAAYYAAQQQPVAYEYVLLHGVNDSAADARELARLVKGTGFVNVIPFNPWPGAPFQPAPESVTAAFVAAVRDAGARATVRWPRGRDILAACGQLRTETVRPRRPAEAQPPPSPPSAQA